MFILSCLLTLTIILNFSVLIQYPLFFYIINFKFYITVYLCLFSLFVCILHFKLFWSCICNFVIILVAYFNLKFCSKFVLFCINSSWLSQAGSSVTRGQLTYFLTVPKSIGWTPASGLVGILLKFKLKLK